MIPIAVSANIKRKIIDAKTGQVVKESPWQKNLVLDQGLDALAQDTTLGLECAPAEAAAYIQVGSGTNPVKVASGAITFTQTGTTLTASGGFFTVDMVGSIFKWGSGTGGAEVYITAFTSSTEVTVATSAEVASPEVGTVWHVQQTALQTFLYNSATYQTDTGDCGTSISGNTITFKRTYVISQKASQYTVNEIGWNSTNSTTRCLGRLVLSSSDVVATSNFYVVILELSFTYSPGAPTAVANVGTNIDTAGNAMVEFFALARVSTAGAVTSASSGTLDGAGTASLGFATVDWTQESSIQDARPSGGNGFVVGSALLPVFYASPGRMRWSYSGSVSTSGQTLYGVGLYPGGSPSARPAFSIHFTTPQTAPSGTLQPITTFEMSYNRNLSN